MILKFDEFVLNEASRVSKYYDDESKRLDVSTGKRAPEKVSKTLKGLSKMYSKTILQKWFPSNTKIEKELDQIGRKIKDSWSHEFTEWELDKMFWTAKSVLPENPREVDKNLDRILLSLSDFDKIRRERIEKLFQDKDAKRKFFKDLYLYRSKYKAFSSSSYDSANKFAKEHGITYESLKYAAEWIAEFTSGSHKKLPEDAFPALRALTVRKNELPKYVYRGFYYDGAKIKDETKFISKWFKGSTPKESLKKPTSWSTDISTAQSFASPDDYVKDRKNGYSIILRWKVSDEYVIADLRQLPMADFFNQSELIVSPEVKDYEVFSISKGSEATDVEIKNRFFFAGDWGFNQQAILKNPLSYYTYSISNVDRERMKELIKMSASEISDKTGVNVNIEFVDSKKHLNTDLCLAAIDFTQRFQGMGNIEAISKFEWTSNASIDVFSSILPETLKDFQKQHEEIFNKIQYDASWILHYRYKFIRLDPMSIQVEISKESDIELKVSDAFKAKIESLLPLISSLNSDKIYEDYVNYRRPDLKRASKVLSVIYKKK